MSRAISLRLSLKRADTYIRTTTNDKRPRWPCNYCQSRALQSRRTTSFWSHSYRPESVPQVPFIPPIPSLPQSISNTRQPGVPLLIDHGEAGVEMEEGEDGKKRERKERYLDSLMDKAGDLSLRCEFVFEILASGGVS